MMQAVGKFFSSFCRIPGIGFTRIDHGCFFKRLGDGFERAVHDSVIFLFSALVMRRGMNDHGPVGLFVELYGRFKSFYWAQGLRDSLVSP